MSEELAVNNEKTGPLPPYSTLPNQYGQPVPQVVTTQPTYTVVNYQPPPTTKLPLYALVTSLIVTIVFAGFCCFVPGLLCLIPAVSTAICGIVKSESNRVVEAKKLAVTSFILVLVFFCTYPFVVLTIGVSTSFIPRGRPYY